MGDRQNGRGGNICCLPNCSTSSGRDTGVSLFKPTSRKGEFYEKWNKEIFNVILKYRVDDENSFYRLWFHRI